MDGAEVDGSLKAIGGTHGVSPYRSYGGPSCVLFYRSGRESRYPGAESLGKSTSYLVHPASRRAPTRDARQEFRRLDSGVGRKPKELRTFQVMPTGGRSSGRSGG